MVTQPLRDAPAARGEARIQVRCTNTDGLVQPAEPTWNGGGYMRNVIETTAVRIG